MDDMQLLQLEQLRIENESLKKRVEELEAITDEESRKRAAAVAIKIIKANGYEVG